MSDTSLYGSYVDDLRGMMQAWREAHPGKWEDARDMGSLGLCRILHLELWNAIDDWNARCPHFPWIPIIPKVKPNER